MGGVVLEAATLTRAPRPVAGRSDHQLVSLVRAGDDRAFEELFHRYRRRITAYVYGMVADHGRAEDIAQEVFVSALRRMRDTERPIAFRPWIYEIAKNACIDAYRRRSRAEEVSLTSDEGQASGRPPAPGLVHPRAPRGDGGQAAARAPVRRLRRPVRGPPSRSSCCASSRACPTARSASAWGSVARRSRARCSGPAAAWRRSTTSSPRARAASASRRSSPPPPAGSSPRASTGAWLATSSTARAAAVTRVRWAWRRSRRRRAEPGSLAGLLPLPLLPAAEPLAVGWRQDRGDAGHARGRRLQRRRRGAARGNDPSQRRRAGTGAAPVGADLGSDPGCF